MAKYTKLKRPSSKSRLGTFEGHGVSNTFGSQLGMSWALFGPSGAVAGAAALGAAAAKCSRPVNELTDADLIECDRTTTGAGQTTIRNELKNRNYELVSGSWQKKKVEEGTSAAEVLTGIAAILNPLATAGVGIFSASQQAKLEKERLKSGGGFAPSGQPIIIPGGGSNTGIIIAVVAVVFIMMGMMMFMMKKK